MIGAVNQPSTYQIMDVDGTLKAGAVDVAAVLVDNVISADKIADNVIGATYNAGVDATLEALSDAAADNAAVAALFEPAASKNLYNPALATDGKIVSYATGTYQNYATGAVLGKVAVVAGQTYTLSMPDSEEGFNNYLSCYDSGGAYLGLDRALSTHPVATGVTLGAITTADGRTQMSFAIDGGSDVAQVDCVIIYPYLAHSTTDFDRIRNSIQLELGATFTSFEAYYAGTLRLLETALPRAYEGLDDRVAALENYTPTVDLSANLVVVANGDNYYLRSAWSASYDLVQRIARQISDDTYNNRLFQFQSFNVVAATVSDEDLPTTTLTNLKAAGDDTAPFYWNGTYIGASHGANFVRQITATSHGKSNEDIGSEWVDGAAIKFYLIRIVDADTLWVISENKGAGDHWDFRAITGSTLTHSADATHTADINIVGTPTTTQLYPSVRDATTTFLKDGVDPIAADADGVYAMRYLRVINSYTIMDVPAQLAYIISQVGGSTEPDFAHSSIAACARVQIIYDFYPNGSCTVQQSLRTYQELYGVDILFVQASPPTVPSGGTLHQYVPGVDAFVVSGTTYDLAAIEDITSLANQLNVAAADWTDANNPPDRYMQFAKTSGGAPYNDFGFAMGFCPTYGDGEPAVRKTQASETAFYLYTSKKMYGRLATSNSSAYSADTLPADTLLQAVAFRCAVDFGADADATCYAYYYFGNDIYLLLDFHTAIDRCVALPQHMIGRVATLVESAGTFTLHSDFAGPDGLWIETGSYGSGVIKLSLA